MLFPVSKRRLLPFPYAFTENVIAMLSGVLRSSTAIEIKMRSQFVTSNKVNFLCHLLRHESSFAKLPASTRQVLPKRRRAPAFGLGLLHFMSESSARTFLATSPPNASCRTLFRTAKTSRLYHPSPARMGLTPRELDCIGGRPAAVRRAAILAAKLYAFRYKFFTVYRVPQIRLK